MILSMTGYGKSKVSDNIADITAEVKTLNSKYLDVSIKLPRALSGYELEVRTMISDQLKRGKVNLVVEMEEKKANVSGYQVNEDLLKLYFQTYQKVAKELGESTNDLFRLAAQSPDVVQNANAGEVDTALWSLVKTCIQQTLERCVSFRRQEGAALEKDIKERVHQIATALTCVKGEVPRRNAHFRERIQSQLQEISQENIDENRFEQEMIYYLEKLDINEEIVRLSNHLSFFSEVLAEPQASGKKLGFVSQEIGREINTIGAKANDAAIQHHVVAMKEELEKIKEQVLNVL
ncbi:YicC/YloC family endoribonuclease [Tunicatimonas pelagia]|uniref:YicC/YloC family endoribonuclease n=1 Tax=Tunicatimonas pelagia TaxID=931531 RepID=UPI00266522EC|nr:YicC/YloC family endoribonuclease [Tunicatimonas pelagia]WKN44495.1 YicC family protein [Tunicatimonas pelagia]